MVGITDFQQEGQPVLLTENVSGNKLVFLNTRNVGGTFIATVSGKVNMYVKYHMALGFLRLTPTQILDMGICLIVLATVLV